MNDNVKTTEAAVVADLATAATAPAQISIKLEGTTALVPAISVPERTTVHSLEHLLPKPLRQRGTTRFLTLKDLHRFMADQIGPKNSARRQESGLEPIVFANKDTLTFTAILNAPNGVTNAWMDYRATVQLKKTRQLTIWQEKNKKRMTQEEFALFLEEYLQDIVAPNSADVLHFAETLEATKTEVFKSSIKTSTGETKLAYSSERQGEQSTELIENFELGIPLFDGGDPYKITVRLFHRVNEQKLTFWFELRHIDYILDQAWDSEVTFMQSALSELADVYEGVPPEPISVIGAASKLAGK